MVISRVPPLLHTPLMAATNAISGISLVGSLIAAGAQHGTRRDDPRLRRRRLRDEQHRRRIPDHRPHAEDVPARATHEDSRSASAGRAARMRELFIQVSYLAASVLFILGLRSLTRPDKARRGMQQAAVGMLLAIAGTLLNHEIVDYRWIAGGLVLGTLIGYPLGMWVPMTAMPQRIALSLTLQRARGDARRRGRVLHASSRRRRLPTHAQDGGARLRGACSARSRSTARSSPAGKLQEWLPSKPVTYRGTELRQRRAVPRSRSAARVR